MIWRCLIERRSPRHNRAKVATDGQHNPLQTIHVGPQQMGRRHVVLAVRKQKARGRADDHDPGRSRDRERSLVHDTVEKVSEPQRNDKGSWIWEWRRGVESRDTHLSMRKEKLFGEQGCGESEEQEEYRADSNLG